MEKRGLSLAEVQEVPKESLILLVGPPGAGKSTFCHQVVLKSMAEAQPFIDQALATVQEAKRIPNLSGYINDRLSHVEWDIKEKFNRIKMGIESVRKAIPEGAIEAERECQKHGN